MDQTGPLPRNTSHMDSVSGCCLHGLQPRLVAKMAQSDFRRGNACHSGTPEGPALSSNSIELAHVALLSNAVLWLFVSPLAWLGRTKMRLKTEKNDESQLVFQVPRNQHGSSGAHEPIIREGPLQAIHTGDYGCSIALPETDTASASSKAGIPAGPPTKG